MKIQADATKLCLASIQSNLQKERSVLPTVNVTVAGLVLEYNRETASRLGALRRFILNRENDEMLIQPPAQQNGLKSLFLEVRNK